MKIMFDTNIILDLLLVRTPFVNQARSLFSALETGQLQGVISATTLTTIFYLASKVLGPAGARKTVSHLLQLFEIAAVNRSVLDQALNSGFPDFEDAVLYHSGVQAGVHGIVTRDIKDYKKATLPIYTPSELLKSFLQNPVKNLPTQNQTISMKGMS